MLSTILSMPSVLSKRYLSKVAGASPELIKRALPKLMLGATLLASAGSVLSAGSAKAVDRSCPPNPISFTFAELAVGDTLTCEDKKLTVIDFDFDTSIAGVQKVNGDLELEAQPNGIYSVDLDFTGVDTLSGFFVYDLYIIPDGVAFDTAKLITSMTDVNPQDNSVFKKQVDMLEGADPLYTVNGNGEDGGQLPLYYRKIRVTDTWSIASGDSVDNIRNEFTQTGVPKVPGPLPIFGAGMAFGFSRKLRKRINARAQA